MYFNGIGTAVPSKNYTKAECLESFLTSDWYARLDSRSHYVLRKVLEHDNGIETRYLAIGSLAEVFEITHEALSKRFLINAPLLATQAAEKALLNANIKAEDIDALIVSTCTGYLCPGLSGYVAERLNLKADVKAFDLVGQGCAAALPNFELCHSLLGKNQCEHVLSICVEVCSAAMYLDNDPGVLISACLFADGAGAAVLSRHANLFLPTSSHASLEPLVTLHSKRTIKWIDCTSRIDPSQRPALMFEHRNGLLRNILTRAVPAIAATYALQVLNAMLAANNLQKQDISTWIMHAGGRDVLMKLEQELKLQPTDLKYSAAMLRQYGNVSSAFVYFVLEAALNDAAPAGWWWLSSFGAGFSCHGALLSVSE